MPCGPERGTPILANRGSLLRTTQGWTLNERLHPPQLCAPALCSSQGETCSGMEEPGSVPPLSSTLHPRGGWTLLLPSLQAHAKHLGEAVPGSSSTELCQPGTLTQSQAPVGRDYPRLSPPALESRVFQPTLLTVFGKQMGAPPYHHPHGTAQAGGSPFPPSPSLSCRQHKLLLRGEGERVAACARAKMIQ